MSTRFAPANAQERDTTQTSVDSTIIRPNTPDSVLQKRNNPPGSGQSGPLQKGEVRFQSTDSLVFDFKQDRVATLYGSGDVNHSAGELKSGKVKLNIDRDLVQASTQTPNDTLSKPVLSREGQPPVKSNKIAFNYKSEKGRFDVARIKIQKGQIIGTKVKNTSRKVIYLKDAKYSTCTLPHPHYYIKADRMKIIKEGGSEEVFFQNARLYILDIPYPLVFPFGYFPGNFSKHQSGVLTPTYVYQNTSSRGLGLRNLGWFQYFSDYVTGQASVDIFTSGTYFLNAGTNYRKRGSYNGNIDIGYSSEQGLEPTDPNSAKQVQKSISINHSQQFSPYSSLSANVNLRTSNYYDRNSYDINDRAQTSTSSSINYRYRQPEDLFNFNASIRQSQNFQNNTVRLSGPSFNFNLKRITPFGGDRTNSEDTKWYENLSLNYQNSFQSNYSFMPQRGDSAQTNWFEALFNPDKYRKATGNNEQYQYGFQQDASISVNNLLDSSFLNLSASANYTEYWFPTSTRKRLNLVTNELESRKVRGFKTARDFSTNLNFSTTIYGLSNVHLGNIVGFRHTIRPNISFSYRPDFSSSFFGFYRSTLADTSGNTQKYSIFENEVFSGPGRGEQRAINIGINNRLEAKQVKRDSTGEKSENILRLIDQLGLNTSYNFAADSLNLSNLNANLTSSVLSGVNLRASANFNFYERNDNGTRINQLLLTHSHKLAELTNFSLNASTQFSGGGGRGFNVQGTPSFPAHYNPLNQSIYNEMDPYFNRQPVQSINSPWSLSLNFSYRWSLNPNGGNNRSATINAQNIQFQLTPKWSFSTQLGYDFIQHKLTPSRFNLNRQLHEWTLSFQMSPFGEFQYYFFKLSINSAQLQSIFQKLPLLKNLERSSSPTGRGLSGFQ